MAYNHDQWQEGNAWENLALVNCQGETQPALGVFDAQSK